jgi:hypothetical protein
MRDLSKPLLATAAIAALTSGLVAAQGGAAFAATSDCSVSVAVQSEPVIISAPETTIAVTTTWAGACAAESPSAAATYHYSQTAGGSPTDPAVASTPILAGYTVESRTRAEGSGTETFTVPTSGLPLAGAYVRLDLTSTTTATGETPTVVTSATNASQIKSSTTVDTKYTRSGRTLTIVGHAYVYNGHGGFGTVALSGSSVKLERLDGSTVQLAGVVKTSGTGRYEFTVDDVAASTYRVSTTASSSKVSASSPAITVAADSSRDTKVIRLSTSKTGTKATIRGTVFVRSATTGNYKATSGVAANLQKKVDGTWVVVKKVRSTDAGQISAVANNVHRTAYRFQVIQNTSYRASTSAYIHR